MKTVNLKDLIKENKRMIKKRATIEKNQKKLETEDKELSEKIQRNIKLIERLKNG